MCGYGMTYFYRRYFFVLGDERRLIEPKSAITRLHCTGCGLTFAASEGWFAYCPFDGTALNIDGQLAAMQKQSALV